MIYVPSWKKAGEKEGCNWTAGGWCCCALSPTQRTMRLTPPTLPECMRSFSFCRMTLRQSYATMPQCIRTSSRLEDWRNGDLWEVGIVPKQCSIVEQQYGKVPCTYDIVGWHFGKVLIQNGKVLWRSFNVLCRCVNVYVQNGSQSLFRFSLWQKWRQIRPISSKSVHFSIKNNAVCTFVLFNLARRTRDKPIFSVTSAKVTGRITDFLKNGKQN